MKYFSTFSGIGGFEIAIHSVFPNAECVGYSEIDKYAIQIYQKHFPTHKNFGDITQINIKNLPDFNLLVGGSPCQDMSIAKKNRKGLSGSRSGLFYRFVEILREKKPKYFLFENVASMSKEDKKIISKKLGTEPVCVNASLVSAQNRKRLFWCNWNVEQPKDRGILLKDVLEECVNEKYLVKNPETKIWERSQINETNSVRIGQIGKGGQGDRIYSTRGKSISLSANGGGRGAKTGLYAVAQRGRYISHGIVAKTKQRIEISGNKKAHTITSVSKDSMIIKNTQIRKLTPLECERLQTFKDGWTEGISDTQRYKCLGNAVCVEVIKHILENEKTKN